MRPSQQEHSEDQAERLCLYAMHALPSAELHSLDAHISTCAECQQELRALRPLINAFHHWPTDVLRAPGSIWERVAQQIAEETGARPLLPGGQRWQEPAWEDVAPGISCKFLGTDTQRHRISMLVRLEPDTEYPPHTHAGVEELHLLRGDLTIDDRELVPGEYNRAEPGTSDARVWSRNGCTCLLVTSTSDVLR